MYSKHYSTRKTPQSEKIPGSKQVANSAGGFAFPVDDWTRLDRFLVLGSEGGSYYATEHALTVENAEAVRRCIAADGMLVVERIVNVSESGRAPKNDPALFALAMTASFGSPPVKQCALSSLPRVARIGTHLFHFAEYVQSMRGWGRGLREAIANWYERHSYAGLAYQIAKYGQRDGWSHADLIRLSHVHSEEKNTLYRYALEGTAGYAGKRHEARAPLSFVTLPHIIAGMEVAKTCDKGKRVGVIQDYRLEREMIPTEWLDDPSVWAALLNNMKMEATLRNLGKMTNVGLIQPGSDASRKVCEMFSSQEAILNSRLHPFKVLLGMKVYEQGHGDKGKLTWNPDGRIVDALDKAFYLAFGNVTPIGKRMLLALDISGSMGGSMLFGSSVSARVGACAMALVTANVEKDYQIGVFETNFHYTDLSPRERLDDVVRRTEAMRMGGTDCAMPMLHALQHKQQYDAFCIYTDSETWAGKIHPTQALNEYRAKMGIPAKLVVIGMTSNEFSIADPDDAGMLDVVGFDSAAPEVIGQFVKGA